MARYRGSLCRLCRAESAKLFLKGDRCYSDKCSFERRSYIPGEHGQIKFRRKASDYGTQLREKQKLKRTFGLLEKSFKAYFEKAEKQKGIAGTNLLLLLERRLDNMVYRLGFANSRGEARQLVKHNHFLVNDKKVNIPSYLVKIGDKIQVKQKSRKVATILDAIETVARRGIPEWLELDKGDFAGVVKVLPTREELTMPIQEQLVVDFYSK
ncbi:MAG: 30S ribosomal protein S4 [Deltaproteobacteria bacterium]|nr:30S ribosomal protein S4 [Deltaproteobacteria bacterium]